MRNTILAFALLLCACMAVAQQDPIHAPTVAQCQADQRLWASQINDGSKDWAHSANNVSAVTLVAWGNELVVCEAVDPDNQDYAKTLRCTHSVISYRMNDFIQRHGMSGQFFAEDKAGKR